MYITSRPYTFMDFNCDKPFTFAEFCIGNRTGVNCADKYLKHTLQPVNDAFKKCGDI
jgi:hypothetical protein